MVPKIRLLGNQIVEQDGAKKVFESQGQVLGNYRSTTPSFNASLSLSWRTEINFADKTMIENKCANKTEKKNMQ